IVKCGDRRVHRIEIGGPLGSRDLRDRRVPENPALDQVHDVEPCAVHGIVRAKPMDVGDGKARLLKRSEEPTSALQSLMRNSYAAFCLKKTKTPKTKYTT